MITPSVADRVMIKKVCRNKSIMRSYQMGYRRESGHLIASRIDFSVSIWAWCMHQQTTPPAEEYPAKDCSLSKKRGLKTKWVGWSLAGRFPDHRWEGHCRWVAKGNHVFRHSLSPCSLGQLVGQGVSSSAIVMGFWGGDGAHSKLSSPSRAAYAGWRVSSLAMGLLTPADSHKSSGIDVGLWRWPYWMKPQLAESDPSLCLKPAICQTIHPSWVIKLHLYIHISWWKIM